MRLLIVFLYLVSWSIFAQTVVSMSPSITEVIASLGKLDHLKGVSSFCSFPKMACTKKKVGTALTPDIEAIISLQPNFVLSQEMKNSFFEKKLNKLGLKSKNFKFDSLTDIKQSIIELGTLLKSKLSKKVITRFEDKELALGKLNKTGKFLAVIDLYEKMGRVTGVLVAGRGTFYSDLLESTGLKNSDLKSDRGAYHRLSFEELLGTGKVSYFFFSPKKNKNAEFLKKELSNFSQKGSRFYSFFGDYVVIPGPRLTRLIDKLIESLR